MTDRKELIERLKVEAEQQEAWAEEGESTIVGCGPELMREAIAALSESQWISVDEQTLKPGEYWGGWFNREDVYYDHVSWTGEGVWWNLNSSNQCEAPTHVRPLPAPPDGE